MSMGVDLSSQLTGDERRYLADRGRYADIERADQLTGGEAQDLGAGDGTGPQLQALGTAEQRAARRAQLEAELAAMQEEDEADDEEVVVVVDKPYAEWTVKDLDDELGNRQLSTSGSKADKVKRLEEDDANAE